MGLIVRNQTVLRIFGAMGRAALVFFVGFFLASSVCLQSADVSKNKAFFWVVRSGQAKAYVLGSIHVGKPDFFPLEDKVERAFEASDMLAVEVNINAVSPSALMMTLAAKAVYLPPDSLKNHVSNDTWVLLQNSLKTRGLPLGQLQQLKPWLIALMISAIDREKAGLSDKYGIDQYFLKRAKDQKPIISIEYLEDQLGLFDGFSDREQEDFLRGVLEEGEKAADVFHLLSDIWKSGDEQRLESLLKPWKNDPALSGLYKKMFDNRNQKMAAQVLEFLRSGSTVFVVVGAGHLVGDNSVIDILRQSCHVQRL